MTAGNAIDHLHDERFGVAFDPRNIDHRTMVFVGGRARESLDGVWRFTPDLFDEGLRQHWYRNEGVPAARRTMPWDGDPAVGYPLRVPSCWNLARPEWLHFEGSAWLSRSFAYLAKQRDERVFLRVGAANYDAKVFLNGSFLGNHVGGSTPFFVELTGRLDARNRLTFCINNTRGADRVPMHHFDWFNYGGIHREVSLIRVPHVFIRDFFVRLDGDAIAVDAELSDPSAHGRARLKIAGLFETVLPVAKGRIAVRIAASPNLWSPERPHLYDVTLSFGADEVSDRIGFRTISTRGQEILLNGTPILLKGACVHEDDVTRGRVTSAADIRRRLRHLRALGGNFLRLTHYPHHELVARLADELGFLLWSEIPVYWAINFANPRTLADATNQLTELIKRDRNRASVVLWGVGNENADIEERLKFMSHLARTAHRLDPSRLVSAACLVNKKAKRIEDRLVRHLDVIGINEYYGWYDANVEDLDAIGRNSRLDKPVVITEVGAEAPAAARSAVSSASRKEAALWAAGGRGRSYFSERKMESIYRAQTAAFARNAWIKGVAAWVLYDFRSERRQNQFQRGFNRKGLIAADKRTKKVAFAILREFYRRWRQGDAATG
jgi:beta-glucuronidase